MLKAGHNITWKTNIVLEYFWTILTRTNGICLTLGMDKSFGEMEKQRVVARPVHSNYCHVTGVGGISCRSDDWKKTLFVQVKFGEEVCWPYRKNTVWTHFLAMKLNLDCKITTKMSSPSKITTGKHLSNFNWTPPLHFPYFILLSSGTNQILDVHAWLDCRLVFFSNKSLYFCF